MALTMRRASAFAAAASRPSPAARSVHLPARKPSAKAQVRRAVVAPVRCQAAPSSGAVSAAVAETATALSVQTGIVNAVNASDISALHEAAQSRLVVVDVYTQWCGPCKMIAPEVEKMAAEFGDVVFTKMDATTINENKKWAMSQNVKALPTFLLFKGGQRVGDMTGAKAASLRKLVEAHM